MGIFDKFKKKVTEKVSTAVEKTSEALKFDKLKSGLEKTRKSISNKIISALKGRDIDQALLDEIEEILITSDIGVITSEKIIDNLRERVKQEDIQESEKLYTILKEEIHKLIVESPSAENDKIYEVEGEKPYSILVIGVNGAGKTTTFKAILGLVESRKGKIYYNDKEINEIPTHERINLGIGYSPSDENVFGKLTVKENLTTSHTNSNVDFDESISFGYSFDLANSSIRSHISGNHEVFLKYSFGKPLKLKSDKESSEKPRKEIKRYEFENETQEEIKGED